MAPVSSAQSGDITIGAAGVGGLQVTNAAALGTSGAATLASKGGPVQQTATIDTEASWQIGGLLEVGLAGSAELAVQGAGQVSRGTGRRRRTTPVPTARSRSQAAWAALPRRCRSVRRWSVGDSGSGTLQISRRGQRRSGHRRHRHRRDRRAGRRHGCGQPDRCRFAARRRGARGRRRRGRRSAAPAASRSTPARPSQVEYRDGLVRPAR